MSEELFLIAHKVRGAPAFDIAIHMRCPTCEGTNDHCTACDGAGHWWIIPTSGHRAFPYWWIGLHEVPDLELLFTSTAPYDPRTTIPEGLRDHYTTEREVATDLIKVLGLIHKPLGTKLPPIKRRL